MDNGARDELNRDLVAAMQELRSLARVPVPATSRERVDREVEAAISHFARQKEEQSMNQVALTTSAVRRVPLMSPITSHRAIRRIPALTWLATAALLVVTLGLSYAAFGPIRLSPSNPIIFPAAFVQGGTPISASETRFEVTFPAPVLPAGRVYAWSNLYAVDSGVSAAYPGFKIDSPVAALVWVQSGTMAIEGEPVAVHRASAGAPETSAAPGELVLGAGDAVGLELGPGRSYMLRSVGTERLVFAEFWMVGGPRPLYGYPQAYQILDYTNLPDAVTLTSPATVTMQLTQAVLAPEETLAPAEGDWQLALADWRSGATVSRQNHGGMKNWSQTPVSVVAMTAEFQEAAATPTS
jgi:hypothetical protein